jgi:hypothetical protein
MRGSPRGYPDAAASPSLPSSLLFLVSNRSSIPIAEILRGTSLDFPAQPMLFLTKP